MARVLRRCSIDMAKVLKRCGIVERYVVIGDSLVIAIAGLRKVNGRVQIQMVKNHWPKLFGQFVEGTRTIFA
jgi:hypothetical protein